MNPSPEDSANIIDDERTVTLGDVGQPDYLAAVAVDLNGREHLVLADRNRVGDLEATYAAHCPDVSHEQLGPLPLAVVRRIVIASRRSRSTQLCGRPTKSGQPCQIPVASHGQACGWHRTGADA